MSKNPTTNNITNNGNENNCNITITNNDYNSSSDKTKPKEIQFSAIFPPSELGGDQTVSDDPDDIQARTRFYKQRKKIHKEIKRERYRRRQANLPINDIYAMGKPPKLRSIKLCLL